MSLNNDRGIPLPRFFLDFYRDSARIGDRCYLRGESHADAVYTGFVGAHGASVAVQPPLQLLHP